MIAAVGAVDGSGTREIDATGLLVTPGFIDLHTHYDGQAIWSDRMTPSSAHGVTTAVMGNCGVGFAPCRAEDHEVLVDVMAGVEDIPGVVMVDGLPWDWETFPEYLDALESRQRDIDVAAYLPHSPLRVYVMGQRGADREPATDEDLERMRALAKEAIEVGRARVRLVAVLVPQDRKRRADPHLRRGAGRDRRDRRGRGRRRRRAHSVRARHRRGRLRVCAAAGFRGRRGRRAAGDVHPGDGQLRRPDLAGRDHADREVQLRWQRGHDITAQMFPRPIGLVIGLELTGNPFVFYPSYREIADLPLAERVAEMRKPEVRARILADKPAGDGHPLLYLAQAWNWIFPLTDDPDYEPDASTSIAARAAARGVTPMEEAYDRLLDDDGHAMLLVAMANFENNSLDTVGELIRRDDVVLGLGDGGAHYGMICDASYPTFLLAHWARDRKARRLSVADAIRNDDIRAGEGRRAGRPRPNRGGLQGGSQRHRPCRTAAAQAGDHPRPACRRASAGPDRRRLCRDGGIWRGDRRERRAHRRASRQAGPRPPAGAGVGARARPHPSTHER